MTDKKWIAGKERKEILHFTMSELSKGSSKEEIFNKLSEVYAEPDTLSSILSYIPDPAVARRYKGLSLILILLLVANSLLESWSALLILLSAIRPASYIILIPCVVFNPLANAFLAYGISKNMAGIYLLTAMAGLIGFLNSNSHLIAGYFQAKKLLPFGHDVGLVLVVVIVLLAVAIKFLLYPYHGLFGPKKNKAGIALYQ